MSDFNKTWGGENCYCYAVNYVTKPKEHNLNPGDFSGADYDAHQPATIAAAVVSDGGEMVGDPANPVQPAAGSKPGFYLIACKSGGGDYHFMRRDETTGIWHQKVPISAPGVFDSVNNIVPHTDPWVRGPAAALPYMKQWVGYFWVPDAGFTKRKRATCTIL